MSRTGLLERQETTNSVVDRKMQENHPKYIKIWVAEVEGCRLDVYTVIIEVMNNF